MTRAAAIEALAIAKRVAPPIAAGMIEDVELRLGDMTAGQAKEYAAIILPPGYRGRVSLVLLPPPSARALAWLACVLRNIEGDSE